MKLAENLQLCEFVLTYKNYIFCRVGEDSHDYGIMLQRLTDNFNQEYELEEVCGSI